MTGNGVVLLDTLATLVPAGLALLIPFVVEALTKRTTSPEFRALLNALGAALVASIATVAFSGQFADLGDYLFNILLAWVVTGRMYLTEWVKVSRKDKAI